MTGFFVHVRDHPTLFALLDCAEREREQFAPPESAANQKASMA